MKTIEEAAKEFCEIRRKISTGYPPKEWFKAGVEFAQRWISVDEGLPEEGLKVITDIDIVCWFKKGKFKNITPTPNKTGGHCDGNMFREDLTDEVSAWRPINLK